MRSTRVQIARGGANECDAWTNYALRYLCPRLSCCYRCCCAVTDRCPIHLGILSACDWQPNNNNQSFGKCVLYSLPFIVRLEISKRAIRFYIMNVASRITVPFFFCELNTTPMPKKSSMPMHFWAWEKHSIMLIYNSCNCFGYRILNFWQPIWQRFSTISGQRAHTHRSAATWFLLRVQNGTPWN